MNAQAQYFPLEAVVIFIISISPLVVGNILFVWYLLRRCDRLQSERDYYATDRTVITRTVEQSDEDEDEGDWRGG
jgi:hypothetical protein